MEDLVRRLTPKGLDTRATVLWAGDGTITVDVERQGLRQRGVKLDGLATPIYTPLAYGLPSLVPESDTSMRHAAVSCKIVENLSSGKGAFIAFLGPVQVVPRRARILVVDDESRVCELLREFLTIQGYDVATAAGGAEALDAVPIFQPDVILVDMRMPGLSGRDFLDVLRQGGLTMPVVLMSGDSAKAGEGFFGILQKPFDLSRTAQLVAAAFAHTRNFEG